MIETNTSLETKINLTSFYLEVGFVLQNNRKTMGNYCIFELFFQAGLVKISWPFIDAYKSKNSTQVQYIFKVMVRISSEIQHA